MPEWVSKFQSQFGSAACVDPCTLCEVAVKDVVPACACAPKDEVQAAAVIRFAAAHRIPVVPCGGGTSQGINAPPPPGFLALGTIQLNKLIHHEPGDMVATVQSGMTLAAFQDALRARGQWLPIDAAPGATIGGIVAANTFGPRALGYGTLRDMVLGMTVINGDGVLRKCGGKVVKNVTGYALDKLYIGSRGTLGLITEVTFKLRPLPVGASVWSIGVPDIAHGCELLRTIAAKNLPLDMMHMLSPAANKSAPGGKYSELHILATGTKPELERIDSEIRTAGLTYTRSNNGDTAPYDMGAWWAQMGLATTEWLQLRNGLSGATLRFGCVATKFAEALAVFSKFQTAPCSLGLGSGLIDLCPLNEVEAARIASEFEKLGVNFAFENVSGVKIENRFGSPRPEWALMKQIKAGLDPQGIMNPGRYVV